jgi:hypothetical protein
MEFFSVAATSLVLFKNDTTWPDFTVDHFALDGRAAREQSKTTFLALSPIVEEDDRGSRSPIFTLKRPSCSLTFPSLLLVALFVSQARSSLSSRSSFMHLVNSLIPTVFSKSRRLEIVRTEQGLRSGDGAFRSRVHGTNARGGSETRGETGAQ